MEIRVRLFGVFRIGRFRDRICSYSEGTTVQDVADDFQLPEQILGIALINGVHAEFNDVLKDGDELSILPLFDGG
mgnify:CR=1 FL=1